MLAVAYAHLDGGGWGGGGGIRVIMGTAVFFVFSLSVYSITVHTCSATC